MPSEAAAVVVVPGDGPMRRYRSPYASASSRLRASTAASPVSSIPVNETSASFMSPQCMSTNASDPR